MQKKNHFTYYQQFIILFLELFFQQLLYQFNYLFIVQTYMGPDIGISNQNLNSLFIDFYSNQNAEKFQANYKNLTKKLNSALSLLEVIILGCENLYDMKQQRQKALKIQLIKIEQL
ncbi:hypothetical protein PPERSA_06260 [Pseudocohnilembus persalinus]|uniref:Transmembrane protein n=1 Tax=Pseudocohnilembus persalinus TaxID=266149 RepID=A0A0V0QVT1_PSEPJ|nr:hypothetical protein PPERSA_06260 [Pseudocohnilembus persalinus]|eukprot:KRX06289.1 hypothetical protein PPERSA_06260 [Pseudocohnilembus persalinus]